MEYWITPPVCFPQVLTFSSSSPVFICFLTLYNPEGNSVWDLISSKCHKTPGIPKFTSLWGAHPFHKERHEELSPTPTQTFKLLQLTGQILIGNYNSINWGWWIIGYVRKALEQGRLVDGSEILLRSCGGRDNRKQLGFLRQRIGRGLAWNPLVFLIQGWLHPKKVFGIKLSSTRDEGDRDWIRNKRQPWETEPGSPGWRGKCVSPREFHCLKICEVWKKHPGTFRTQGIYQKEDFSGIFQVLFLAFQWMWSLSSLPALEGISSSALHSWSQHGTIPKPGFAAPWHWSCHAPWILLIPLPVDPHSPGSPSCSFQKYFPWDTGISQHMRCNVSG